MRQVRVDIRDSKATDLDDAGSLIVRAAGEAEAVGQQRQAAHRARVVAYLKRSIFSAHAALTQLAPARLPPPGAPRDGARGALACLKFAREEGIEWDEHVVGWAAEVGNHEILRYALRRKAPQPEFWVRPEGFEL